MNNYNFGELLSPVRFEQLTRDLLSNKYGVFENFAEGKDEAIDFRRSQSNNKILIVQCKRYKNVSNLISNLKKEASKVQHLNFSDYLLVVSLDLTNSNKEKIIQLFNGKIQSPNQIITRGDLNYLLGVPSNHYIEFKYPELWMKSINIHQKVFNLGFLKSSESIKNNLKEALKNFVPYKEFHQVIDHLKKDNIVIVSGNPGIGKTTLSYAVISHFLHFENYQLIDLSYRKIQEAEAYIYQDEPTIFFIDDFLGRIKLDKDNDYAQLLLFFIKKIEDSPNKKLIIASREYILRKANKDLFPVQEINQTILKYVIELKSFTRRIRTEILYNHIKNSDLNSAFIDNFLQSDFKRIIDHKNYNPRIIKHLTDAKLLKDIKAEDYHNFFIDNLENPSGVWENVYDNLPNDLYKIILLIKFLISEQLPVENLEKAVTSLIENSDKFRHYSYDDFEHAIYEMEGTFFTFKDGCDELVDEKYTLVEFQNPSIMDFINNFIWKKTNWLNLIIENAVYFEQLFHWELLEVIEENNLLLRTFRSKILKDFNKLDNATIGYSEYEDHDYDEGVFTSWIPARYNYYLAELLGVIDIDKDKQVADFLRVVIFNEKFDGTEEISEKISFSKVATALLNLGLIDSEKSIRHYTAGFCNDIKELVFLEYMTRECTKESLKIIKNNKQFVREADELFLNEIETINGKDFMVVS